MPDYLTAPERETVVLTSDADDVWVITTQQRKVLTKLRRAGWEPIEDLDYHGQPGGRFEIPYNALVFRSRSAVERVMPEDELARRREQMAKARRRDVS